MAKINKKKKNANLPDFSLERIEKKDYEDIISERYISYALSVIISRAIPDIRDGFKPVHRRILYSLFDLGITPDKQHKKSARIVGDVLGKYHPHGQNPYKYYILYKKSI